MNSNPILSGEALIEIKRERYEDLIRTETKYNLLRNAIEEHDNYTCLDSLKKCFGIPLKTYGKENTNEQ